jgi:hypothetical protein
MGVWLAFSVAAFIMKHEANRYSSTIGSLTRNRNLSPVMVRLRWQMLPAFGQVQLEAPDIRGASLHAPGRPRAKFRKMLEARHRANGGVAQADSHGDAPVGDHPRASTGWTLYTELVAADGEAGRRMSVALAVELNSYPGPRHVLELAHQLNLSPEQLLNVERSFAEMTSDAVALGKTLIAEETKLDGQFTTRTVTQGNLSAAIATIGQQLHRYFQLWGYTGSNQGDRPAHRK